MRQIFTFALLLFSSLMIGQDGTLDVAFNPGNALTNGSIYDIDVQTDGSVIIVGSFTEYNNVDANRVLRLDKNGAIDNTFWTNIGNGTGADADIYAVKVLNDGRILLGGNFTTFNGNTLPKLVLLNANGTTDLSFSPSGVGFNGAVLALEEQADGQLLVGGEFTSFNGSTNVGYFARMNTDGSLEAGFGSIDGGADFYVWDIEIQPSDNKILISGEFNFYGSSGATGIARLETNGTIDPTFNSADGVGGAAPAVFDMALLPDERVLIGGEFNAYNSNSVNNVALILQDGEFDASFTPGDGADGGVNAVAITADNKFMLGGNFNNYDNNAASKLVKTHTDGSYDNTFPTNSGANQNIDDIIITSTTSLLIAGSFTSWQTDPLANRIGLLNNSVEAATYYSQSDGTFDVPTRWNTVADGSGTDANSTSFTDGISEFIVQSSHLIDPPSSALDINNLTIEDGGTLMLFNEDVTIRGTTTIEGQLQDTGPNGINTFTGLVDVANTGVLNSTFGPHTFLGGIINDGTISTGGNVLVTFSTNAQTITPNAAITMSGEILFDQDVTFLNGNGTVVLADGGNRITINSTYHVYNRIESPHYLEFRGAALRGAGTIVNETNAFIQLWPNPSDAITDGMSIDASATGNIFEYHRAGSGTVWRGTYHHLDINASGSSNTVKTLDGSLIVNGDLNISHTNLVANGHNIELKGDLTGSGTGLVSSAIDSLTLTGASAQTINNSSLIPLQVGSFVMNNANGVDIQTEVAISNRLSLIAGAISLTNTTLSLGSNASTVGSFSSTEMIIPNSSSRVRKYYDADGSFVYPVGTSTVYTPLEVQLNTGTSYGSTGSNYIDVTPVATEAPSVITSGISLTKYWNVASNGISTINANVTLSYDQTEVNGDESVYKTGYYTSDWEMNSSVNTTANTANFTFNSAAEINGTFTVGELDAFTSPPTIQASNILFSNFSSTQFDLNWTRGNGDSVLVIAHVNAAVDATPTDGSTYSASSIIMSGDEIGTGNYVIYNGTGNGLTLVGIIPGNSYTIQAFEYNGNAGNENFLTTIGIGNPATLDLTPEIEVYQGTDNSGISITDGQTSDIDFGFSQLNSAIPFDFAIENLGDADLNISSITISNSSYTVSNAPITILAGTTESFQITLDASVEGSFSGNVVINNDDSDEGSFTFPITGEIQAPEIDVYLGASSAGTAITHNQATAIDFGTTAQGVNKTLTFTIDNPGSGDLFITNFSFENTDYTFPSGFVSSVTSGFSETFQIQLDATNIGVFNDSLTIESNDADEPIFKFAITGEVTSAAPTISTPTGIMAFTNNNDIEVIWNQDSTGLADQYNIFIGTLPSILTLNSSTNSLTDTSITLTGLNPNTQYYIAVQAITIGVDSSDTSGVASVLTTVEAGNALSISLLPEYVDLSTCLAEMEGLNAGTIAGWFNSSNSGSTPSTLISISEDATSYMHIGIGDNSTSFTNESFFYTLSRGGSEVLSMYILDGSEKYNDNTWHHFAVITGDGNNRILIDGEPQTITYGAGTATTNELSNVSNAGQNAYIGILEAGSGPENQFVGQMDEIALWDVSLTDIQIDQIKDQNITPSRLNAVGASLPIHLYTFDDLNAPENNSVSDCNGFTSSILFGGTSTALHPYEADTLIATAYETDSIVVSWSENKANDILSYWVYEGDSENFDTTGAVKHVVTDTSITFSSLIGCDTTWYVVVAVDLNGQIGVVSEGDSASYCSTCDPFYISSTDDDLTCGTLRYAITEANLTLQSDTIRFDLLNSSTLDITSNLPDILTPMVIDATTSPDWAGTPVISISSNNTSNIFNIKASATTIKGFAFSQLNGVSHIIESEIVDSITIQNNYFSVDITGEIGGEPSVRAISISDGTHHLIGGTQTEEINLFGASTDIAIFLNQVTNTTIEGNVIGTNLAQNSTSIDFRPEDAVSITNAEDVTFTNNTLANVASTGLFLSGSKHVSITNNEFGADVSGAFVEDWAAGDHWIYVSNSDSNTIGSEGGGNTILKATNSAILIEQSHDNKVLSNHIGIEANGTITSSEMGSFYGISLLKSSRNQIGGLVPAQGNTIVQANIGILIDTDSLNTLWSNLIYETTDSPISFINQAQSNIQTPAINETGEMTITGTASSSAYLQLFADVSDQARVLIDTLTADADGTWSYTWTNAQLTNFLSQGLDSLVVMQDSLGHSSMLSDPRRLFLAEPISFNQSSFSTSSSTSTSLSIDLVNIITDPSFVLDTSSIAILDGPYNGATAILNSTTKELTIDLSTDTTNAEFDSILVTACDIYNNCETEYLKISIGEVLDELPDIVVFNTVQPSLASNNYFRIDYLEEYDPASKVYIFDKWGNCIYEKEGYDDSDENNRWNGKYKDELLPEGTYYYVINLYHNGERIKNAREKGFIELKY